MPLVFRDHQIVVISPGSLTTLVQSGIPDSLGPAQYEVATRIFRSGEGRFSLSGSEDDEIRPLHQGRIVNLPAFQYYLKVIYNNLLVLNVPPPALLLISSLAWNERERELLTKYLFEEVGVPALTMLDSGLAVAYGYAAPDSMIIDVGYDKTELSFLKDFVIDKMASRLVPFGGSSINKSMAAVITNLNDEEIESLKCSHIAEVLSAEDDRRRREILGNIVEGSDDRGDEEEGVVNVAAIVSSGNAREILEQRERQKNQANSTEENGQKSNSELEINTFVDSKGVSHTVGKERFVGTDSLLNAIVESVAEAATIISPTDQLNMWQNICITGRGALLRGFRTALISRLEERLLLHQTVLLNNKTNPLRPAPNLLNTADGTLARQTPEELELPVQQPLTIRTAKLSDHFPEWKSENWDSVALLGAQIAAKQSFTTGLEGLFVSRLDYNELGPVSITEVC